MHRSLSKRLEQLEALVGMNARDLCAPDGLYDTSAVAWLIGFGNTPRLNSQGVELLDVCPGCAKPLDELDGRGQARR